MKSKYQRVYEVWIFNLENKDYEIEHFFTLREALEHASDLIKKGFEPHLNHDYVKV